MEPYPREAACTLGTRQLVRAAQKPCTTVLRACCLGLLGIYSAMALHSSVSNGRVSTKGAVLCLMSFLHRPASNSRLSTPNPKALAGCLLQGAIFFRNYFWLRRITEGHLYLNYEPDRDYQDGKLLVGAYLLQRSQARTS